MPIKAPPLPDSKHMKERKRSGRPTKYKPEFCEEVTELAKTGASMAEICSHFDICRQTIDNWAATYPEFLEALTRAKLHAQAWWEALGRQGLVANKFNGKIWEVSMRARFRNDYTERKELTGKDGGPIQTKIDDGALDDAEQLLAGLSQRNDATPQAGSVESDTERPGEGETLQLANDSADKPTTSE